MNGFGELGLVPDRSYRTDYPELWTFHFGNVRMLVRPDRQRRINQSADEAARLGNAESGAGFEAVS